MLHNHPDVGDLTSITERPKDKDITFDKSMTETDFCALTSYPYLPGGPDSQKR